MTDLVRYESWGRYPRAQHVVRPLHWRTDQPFRADGLPVLPFGQGRSYGDSCLNDGGVLLATAGLDRFISFDEERGILRCEAGVTLARILELAVPRGWFLPVVPGTKYVSVGGAIANDVHGKNHHRAGTFGRHVRSFDLLRSSGAPLACSPGSNAELYRATIGGLGLTGLVLAAELQLRRCPSPVIEKQTVPLRCLDEFFEVSAESDREFEYTVAWIDCVARGARTGRGLFYRGDPGAGPATAEPKRQRRRSAPLRIPIDLPSRTLNRLTVAAFNSLYYAAGCRARPARVDHDAFFFPLDHVLEWNRVYGSAGLLQFQCVVPQPVAREALRELLERISASGDASFLAVLKTFGDVPSPGLLSFPRPGVTLALDFPNRGPKTCELLDALTRVVRTAGGAIYPAKDARMTPEDMAAFYPRLPELERCIDPAFSSSFWRRVRPAG